MLVVTCPSCKIKLQAGATSRIRCPKCQFAFDAAVTQDEGQPTIARRRNRQAPPDLPPTALLCDTPVATAPKGSYTPFLTLMAIGVLTVVLAAVGIVGAVVFGLAFATKSTIDVATARIDAIAADAEREAAKYKEPDRKATVEPQPPPVQPDRAKPPREDPKPDPGSPPEEPVKVYGPVPSLIIPGKVGAAAYDAYPEPWREEFVGDWRRKLSKAQDALAAAERKLEDAEKAYTRDRNVSLPNGRRLSMDRDAIAVAKATIETERRKVAVIEKNDPPLFISKNQREAAEYAALSAEERAGREAATERLRKWRLEQEEKERVEREQRRKAEEEEDFDGLILMRKTVEGKRNRFGLTITGTIVNRRGHKLRHVQITFNLYDEKDGRVGTARDVITDLEEGGKWTFKAASLEADAAKFKLVKLIAD